MVTKVEVVAVFVVGILSREQFKRSGWYLVSSFTTLNGGLMLVMIITMTMLMIMTMSRMRRRSLSPLDHILFVLRWEYINGVLE